MANVLADKEDFNTRYGSLNGWREAVRKVKPTSARACPVQPVDTGPLGATAERQPRCVDVTARSLSQRAACRKVRDSP